MGGSGDAVIGVVPIILRLEKSQEGDNRGGVAAGTMGVLFPEGELRWKAREIKG